jgi:hypothetical protein
MIQPFPRNQGTSRTSVRVVYITTRLMGFISGKGQFVSNPCPSSGNRLIGPENSWVEHPKSRVQCVERSPSISGTMTRYSAFLTVQDLAKRFADGRLSTQKILSADDEELAKMLIEVRGIGRVSEGPT